MGNKQNGPTTSIDLSNGNLGINNSNENVGNRQRTISGGLQRRLSNAQGRPVFNMKIIVRGLRGTGKSALLRRLRNKPFETEYIPTPEIDVVNVSWSYKATDELIKLEAWEIVDKAIVDRKDLYSPPPPSKDGDSMMTRIRRSVTSPTSSWESTKTQTGSHRVGALDASMIDVYKSTSAVVFLVDPRKPETLDYAVQEVPKVPNEVMCVVLINFKDMVHNQPTLVKIHPSDLQRLAYAAQHLDIVVFECCLKDCYGLKTLHNYLNLPFLALKEKAIAEKLKRAQEERIFAKEEINTYIQESNYINHLDYLNATSPKLSATQKLQQNLATQDHYNNNKDQNNNQQVQMPTKFNLNANMDGLEKNIDLNVDDIAAMDAFFAENGDELNNLDDFFGEKSAIIKPTPVIPTNRNNIQNNNDDNITDMADNKIDQNNLDVKNPFLDEDEDGKFPTIGTSINDKIDIHDINAPSFKGDDKEEMQEVEEIQDGLLMTENFNENDCKNELGNNLSEAAKTVILNASKFQDDFVDSDGSREDGNENDVVDEKKKKKDKKKKKEKKFKKDKGKKLKKEKKRKKKKPKKKGNTSSESDYDNDDL